MRPFEIVLTCLIVSLPVHAEEPKPPPAPIISFEAMKVRPPMTRIVSAFAKSGLHDLSTSVTIAYDQSGNVVGVKIDKPTGSKALDRAVLGWAAEIKIDTQEAGFSSIPVIMTLD